MIDIGGEIRAQGRNARGEPWHIAIERPVDASARRIAGVWLDGASVSTSGEYRDYYERDGRRYSHTIDPRTRRPLDRPPGSVVVIASATAQADGWATALNVLGRARVWRWPRSDTCRCCSSSAKATPGGRTSTPEFERYRAR